MGRTVVISRGCKPDDWFSLFDSQFSSPRPSPSLTLRINEVNNTLLKAKWILNSLHGTQLGRRETTETRDAGGGWPWVTSVSGAGRAWREDRATPPHLSPSRFPTPMSLSLSSHPPPPSSSSSPSCISISPSTDYSFPLPRQSVMNIHR